MLQDGSHALGVPSSGDHHDAGRGGLDRGETVLRRTETTSGIPSSGRKSERGGDSGGDSRRETAGIATGDFRVATEDSELAGVSTHIGDDSKFVPIFGYARERSRVTMSELAKAAKLSELWPGLVLTAIGIGLFIATVAQKH